MRRFAVINCYPWDHGLARNGCDLWISALAELGTGEEWVIFDACNKGECPAPEDGPSFSGVVVSGSPHGVYDDLPWMRMVSAFPQAVNVPTDAPPESLACRMPRVIGGCFGAQIIGQAMGGTVEKQGFLLLRAEEVVFTSAFNEQMLVASAASQAFEGGSLDTETGTEAGAGASAVPATRPTVMRLISCHGDCVRKLPPDSILLASSAHTEHEVFRVGENFIGIQSHPEFRYDPEVRDVLLPRSMDRLLCTSDEWAAESVSTFNAGEGALDSKDMLAVLRRFIRRE